MNKNKTVNFLYELGTMRKLMRSHYQTLLTNDSSDNIASHSYRVSMIGWFLAKEEKVDPYKVVMMCLLHDVGESRTGDQNWVHKTYVKTFDDNVIEDQFKDLDPELLKLSKEFKKRRTIESKIAKDADLLDQILLLREYEHQGNKEAHMWLSDKKEDKRVSGLTTNTAKQLASHFYKVGPSDWWKDSWSRNRIK